MSEQIEGRNAVLEAFRSGKCVDKLFILDGCQDGPVRTIAKRGSQKRHDHQLCIQRKNWTSSVRHMHIRV